VKRIFELFYLLLSSLYTFHINVHPKEASIDRLHAEIELLKAEKNATNKKFHDLRKEYDALKSSSEQRITQR